MYEAIPVGLGIVLGVMLARTSFVTGRMRWALIAVVSLVVGFAVAAAVGELSESILFGFFDAAQVALATVVSMEVVKRYVTPRVH